MADFALFAPKGCYHSGLGAMLDAYTLVRQQVERVFHPPHDAIQMETSLRLLTQTGAPVQFAGGRTMAADGSIDHDVIYSWVHLPGFETGGPFPLKSRLSQATPVLDWLRRQHAEGAIISASGAAIFYLVEAGLAESLPLPLPRALTAVSRTLYPRIPLDDHNPLVEGDRIVLGGGPATDALLMARLIARTISAEMSHWLISVIGTSHVGETIFADDPLVANALLWLEHRFTQDIKIADLAQAMSTSHQTLIRRFARAVGMRPREYVQHLRMEAAQRMLQTTSNTIDRIAALVGYRDVRSFRAIFHEHTGMSATAYRKATREVSNGQEIS